MFLLLQEDALLLIQSYIRKHSNLGRDVAPVSWGSKVFNPLPESFSHVNNPGGHGSDAVPPLLVEVRIVQDSIHYPDSVSWWIRVHGPDDQGHLGLEVHNVALILHDDSQITSPFIIQAKVLAE